MGMTNKEATHKLEYSKKAYQMLIDEKVDSGKFVGKDVEGEWKADTPLDEAYKSMIEALDLAIQALEQQPSEDCISREAVIKIFGEVHPMDYNTQAYITNIQNLPSITPQQTRWVPVSERLPKELESVNITWVNHNPESYYADIKDKPFTATGVYFNGQWYWWSTLCTDILAEYSHNYDDIIDDDIEITAWMPLPEPYKESEGKE